ncbi:hypothetical protein [Kordiimonas lacus]|uniref:Cytochrome c oxidase cbb3-type subunit 4 n=1 Tax=Kordiimonas lacus TaxID=637679 RepID=A0A1G6W3N7_9PROT|nr:hypothetical protein [Kordiimonas lacus]SDD59646.1 hypothetical protein SAMN04488071_0937 [Kordiimonas lacus]
MIGKKRWQPKGKGKALETLYFIGFCFFAAWLVYWMVKNDDYDDFAGDEDNSKFNVSQNKEERDR